MTPFLNRLLTVALLLSSAGRIAAADATPPPRDLLTKYCYGCHSSAKHKGDFDLEALGLPDATPAHLEGWEKVLANLADLSMPPKEKPQPAAAERERVTAWIDQALDGPQGGMPSDPGFVTIHRLTHVELNRTIHDLLGLDGDFAAGLPADSAAGTGFDNDADALFVSPQFLERFLDTALAIVQQAGPERLGVAKPDKDTPAAKRKAAVQSLTAFLPRAWRRPVAASEVDALVRIYERCAKKPNIADGDALRLAYAAALASPDFLFRIEQERSGKDPYLLQPYELAARLSYFLWSTMPDQELLAQAQSGALKDPATVAAQTKRLLADPRSRIFISQFVGGWLGTGQLAAGLGPDQKNFPEYDPALRAAMTEEPVAFLAALLRDNRSLLELIDCDYVYVNADLARLYGLDGPTGAEFVRVPVGDGRRGGLVAMAGVLAVTSRPARTSPVIRGKWLLETLFSAPPPPPPPNVPPLPESGGDVAKLSVRQRLEQHRKDPACASCHERIDPLGFGLENYDALGRWREHGEDGGALDTVGTLPGGETFHGPQQLKQLLMKRRERIMTTLISKLLSYALGRSLERYDRPTVRHILADLTADGFHAQKLVEDIVLSLPFRYKRNQLAAAAPAPLAKQSVPENRP